jgi:selenoprotein W-related protein
MVEHLLGEFEQHITKITLVPSGGGVFEVSVDGDLVYSKNATGRHAEPEDVLEPVRGLVGG